MNREIKFRAWIKKSELGNVVNVVVYHPSHVLMGWDFEGETEMVLMQYTGLKDKNGKEIYEGDIVEFLYKNPESQEKLSSVRCVIVWSDEGAWALNWSDGYINGSRLQPKKYTVIGNIYENQDLLK